MNRIIYGFTLCLLLTGCGRETQTAIDYKEATGYFVRNDVPDKTITEKITSQEQFDQYFGAATIMSQHPTAIDFSKEYIAAIVLPTTDYSTEIIVDSLIRNQASVNVYYSVSAGQRQSFSVRPALLLILNRSRDENLNFKANDVRQEIPEYIQLNFKDGTARATVMGKAKNENITFAFEAGNAKRLHGTIASPDKQANIRFTQLFMPDGSADGPFSQTIDYSLSQSGLYKLVVGENKMAGDPWSGMFTVEITLTE